MGPSLLYPYFLLAPRCFASSPWPHPLFHLCPPSPTVVDSLCLWQSCLHLSLFTFRGRPNTSPVFVPLCCTQLHSLQSCSEAEEDVLQSWEAQELRARRRGLREERGVKRLQPLRAFVIGPWSAESVAGVMCFSSSTCDGCCRRQLDRVSNMTFDLIRQGSVLPVAPARWMEEVMHFCLAWFFSESRLVTLTMQLDVIYCVKPSTRFRT